MAKKKESDIQKVVPPAGVPSYLAPYADEAKSQAKEMAEYRVVPRVKIIQGMSEKALKDQFGEGAVIVSPGGASMAGKEETFLLNPIFFFTEFCVWSDRSDRASPSISARSFDKGSDIAARARDGQKRIELYGEVRKQGEDPPYKRRYVEHLNFVCRVQSEDPETPHPLHGQLVSVSFNRGEFNQGKNFISAVTLRSGVPLWAQRWEFSSQYRERGEKKWWGLDFAPAENPNISEEEVADCKNTCDELKKLFEAQRLIVDHSELDDDTEGETPAKTKF